MFLIKCDYRSHFGSSFEVCCCGCFYFVEMTKDFMPDCGGVWHIGNDPTRDPALGPDPARGRGPKPAAHWVHLNTLVPLCDVCLHQCKVLGWKPAVLSPSSSRSAEEMARIPPPPSTPYPLRR